MAPSTPISHCTWKNPPAQPAVPVPRTFPVCLHTDASGNQGSVTGYPQVLPGALASLINAHCNSTAVSGRIFQEPIPTLQPRDSLLLGCCFLLRSLSLKGAEIQIARSFLIQLCCRRRYTKPWEHSFLAPDDPNPFLLAAEGKAA